jgi:hypothetical protein
MDKHQIAVDAVLDHHALQKPEELELLLRLLQPNDLILEIGCDAGGTSWAFKQCGCFVVGLNLPDAAFSSGRPLIHELDMLITANSHNAQTPDFVNRGLKMFRRIGYDLIMIDGDHTYDGCMQDYEMYNSFATGMIAFHDICHHPNNPEVGVDKVWEQVRSDGDSTEIVFWPYDWAGIGVMDPDQQTLLERYNMALAESTDKTIRMGNAEGIGEETAPAGQSKESERQAS